jgi:NADH-quinone oxidoreductase subunit A
MRAASASIPPPGRRSVIRQPTDGQAECEALRRRRCAPCRKGRFLDFATPIKYPQRCTSHGTPRAVASSKSSSNLAMQYVPILIMFALAAGLVALMVNFGRWLGPSRTTASKYDSFECGNESTGSAWGRFSVKFYLTAILFIIFDVEVVFLYPWAVAFNSLGLVGLVEMVLFIAILVVGFWYAWKKGALEWD